MRKLIIILVILVVVMGAIFTYQFFQSYVTGVDVKNAKEVFNQYSVNSRDNYVEAYTELSEHNKKDISLELYKEWRAVSAKCIEVKKFSFDTVKKYRNPKLEGVRYRKAIQLSGSVKVKDLIKNEVTERPGKIYIVYEKGQWKIFDRVTSDSAKSTIDQFELEMQSSGK